MVAVSQFLRIFLPFEIHVGWRTIEDFFATSWSSRCPAAVMSPPPELDVNTAYRAPKVKFMHDRQAPTPPPSPPLQGANFIPEPVDDLLSNTYGWKSYTAPKLHSSPVSVRSKPRRRTRSIGIPEEADHSTVTVGDADFLFSDRISFREEQRAYAQMQALKATMHDKEIQALRQTVDDLTEELNDARDILNATEMQVEEVLSKNIKLERTVKTLTYENAQLWTQSEQYLHDITTLHEWIYSVQGTLTQLGIYPSNLNEKLTVKMKKSPRPFPMLSPEVSSRLTTSPDYFTPPSSPPPKAQGFKPEKGNLTIRTPSSGCSSGRTSPEWDGECMRPFAASSPVACSSPARTRSPSPFTLGSS